MALGPPPTYDEESALLEEGYTVIAGIDEAGRGSLAGPVVAAAAVLPVHPTGEWLRGIRDSKQLTPRRRLAALETMGEASATLATGAADAGEIDTLGIIEGDASRDDKSDCRASRIAAIPPDRRDDSARPRHSSTIHHQGRRQVPLNRRRFHRSKGHARRF